MSSSTTWKSRSARCARSSRAEVARLGALVIAAAVLSGCDATIGHDRLAEDRFEVSYKYRADLCALLYSAELTLAAGYSHFYAASGIGPSVTSSYVPGPAVTTIVSKNSVKTVSCGAGLPGCGGTYSTYETPSFYEIHLLEAAPDPDEAWRIVRRLAIRPEDLFVYDASVVRSSMRADESAECSLDLPVSLEPLPDGPVSSR